MSAPSCGRAQPSGGRARTPPARVGLIAAPQVVPAAAHDVLDDALSDSATSEDAALSYEEVVAYTVNAIDQARAELEVVYE